MNEREPTGPEKAIDLRRLEVAARRFETRIAEGISSALAQNREIDDGTARMIAHVLGRAYGPSSELAEFGRTGEATYLALRDEYLPLYNSDTTANIREWINWLGTYLTGRENSGSGRRFMNEHQPPKLEQLLVGSNVTIDGQQYGLFVPASADGPVIADLRDTLATLQLPGNEALQAFLQLPDVDATSAHLVQSFQESFAGSYSDMETLVRALSPLEDWEIDLAEWRSDHGVEPEALEWNLELLTQQLREIYDVVDWKGRLHAFSS